MLAPDQRVRATANARRWTTKNRERLNAARRGKRKPPARNWLEYRARNEHKIRWYQLKRRCKTLGLQFDLMPEDLIMPEICPVLGIQLHGGRKGDGAAQADRSDPTKGYVRGNVAVISAKANRIKGNCTSGELLAVATYVQRVWK